MRIYKLWLEDYYNLKDCTIRFRDCDSIYGSASIRFFVGLNGSGKSRALEAIGLIFSHLSADRCPGIGFEIDYELNGRQIRVSTRKGKILDRIGVALMTRESADAEWEDQEVWASSGTGIVPTLVVGYSTGPTTGLPWTMVQSIDKRAKDIREPESRSGGDYSTEELAEDQQKSADQQDVYYAESNTIFLGGDDALCAVIPLLAHDGVAPEEVKRYKRRRNGVMDRVGLDRDEPLQAFSLLVAGDWRTKLSPRRRTALSRLLRRAHGIVPVDVDSTDSVPRTSDSEEALSDFCAAFDIDPEFQDVVLKKLYPRPLAFFRELLAWKRQGALREIHLVLKKSDPTVRALLPENALSDGEYLYLGRNALLLMVRETPESLVLFDEPDTHYNDQWKKEMVQDIRRCLRDVDPGYSKSSYLTEVLVATHSDLTLTDADPRQVYYFDKGQVRPSVPILSFAADRDQVSKALSNSDGSVRSYSELMVERALRGKSEERVRELLDITGPGFTRYLLRRKLASLTGDSNSGGEDASSSE
ncbi:MAG: hypothetical protein ABFD54_06485 [Armatimonadota bacterium]|nr:hypothetical protein [bacterium]